MKAFVIAAAAALLSVAAPAAAADFTGPRAGVTLGYDNVQGEEGLSYGVSAGYDVAVAPQITAGVEVTLGDSTVDGAGLEASRDIAGSVRLGYVATPSVLVFGKVGYVSSRVEAGNFGAAFEGVRFGGGLEYALTDSTYISAEYVRTEYEANIGGRDGAVVGIGFRF